MKSAVDHGAPAAQRLEHQQGGRPRPHYEPAAIRWLARLCLEHPTISFDDLTHLLAAFEALPTQPTEAWAALATICAHHDIPTSTTPR